ncbi:hypothetical protein SESBI_00355 [Sesbania bispinosa]|nr:hypothetical protein SESBI_00355 [Sesbania bispinosa]
MALEQQISNPNNSVDSHRNGEPPPSSAADGGEDGGLPRGCHVGRGTKSWSSYTAKPTLRAGSSPVEPPVQRLCRKRWSNLAGDYKKIKEWESRVRDETESFWLMRNDLRRERKLPGYFDREVFDILDAPSQAAAAAAPSTATVSETVVGDEEVHLYDSNRRVGGEDGYSLMVRGMRFWLLPRMFLPLFLSQRSNINRTSMAAKGKKAMLKVSPMRNSQPLIQKWVLHHKGDERGSGLKNDGEEENLQSQLIDVLEKNGKMLRDQLEAQNINFQLDRQHQKDTASNIVAVLDKLADALGENC